MKTLLFLAGACLCASSQAAFLVDNFTTVVPQTCYQTGVGGNSKWAGGGSMFGGSRGLITSVTSSNFGLTSSLEIVPGVGAVSDDTGNLANFYLGYLGTGADGSGGLFYSSGTNVNMSGISGFEFDMKSSDKSFDLTVFLISDAGTQTWSKAFGPIASPTTIMVTNTDNLAGVTDMGAIDFLAFGFSPERDGDLVIAEIRAVPEPGTVAVLGLGALALLRKRRA